MDIANLSVNHYVCRKLKDHTPVLRSDAQIDLLTQLRYKKDTVTRYWTVTCIL